MPGGTHGDVHPAVVRQHNRLYFLKSFLPVFWAQTGVLLYLLLNLIDAQVLLLAESPSVKVGFGNSLLNQEGLGQLGTPFGEGLVVGLRSTLVSMSGEFRWASGLTPRYCLKASAMDLRVSFSLGSRAASDLMDRG